MKDLGSKIYQLLTKRFGNIFSDQLLMFNDKGMIKVEKEHALGVYTIRARIQKENQGEKPLLGYDELLKNLEIFDGSMVLIHSFLSDNDLFVFFTDLELQIIIGVLSTGTVPSVSND